MNYCFLALNVWNGRCSYEFLNAKFEIEVLLGLAHLFRGRRFAYTPLLSTTFVYLDPSSSSFNQLSKSKLYLYTACSSRRPRFNALPFFDSLPQAIRPFHGQALDIFMYRRMPQRDEYFNQAILLLACSTNQTFRTMTVNFARDLSIFTTLPALCSGLLLSVPARPHEQNPGAALDVLSLHNDLSRDILLQV